MTAQRVLVVGVGSIGARHARNLAALGAAVTVTDPDQGRAAAVSEATPLPWDPAGWDGFDLVLVCSPTRFHVQHALAGLASGAHVFVEKPLATGPAELEGLRPAPTERLMVGYNLRFHEPVVRVAALVAGRRPGRVHSGRFWFGGYLPDWRPGVDYRGTYSARADLGGGILLDAIHELDLAVWMFGPDLSVVGAAVDRLGHLEVDVEDTVKAILRSADGAIVDVSLDYLSRRYRRGIEVIGDEATVRLDWARQVIEIEDSAAVETVAADTPLARSYELEAAHALAWQRGEVAPSVSFEAAAASVRLACAIRQASSWR